MYFIFYFCVSSRIGYFRELWALFKALCVFKRLTNETNNNKFDLNYDACCWIYFSFRLMTKTIIIIFTRKQVITNENKSTFS